MPSMVNASFAALVCALFAAHFAATNLFKMADHDMQALVTKKSALDPPQPVDALLVGGSGMHYGLNARLLSETTPYNFLNLALFREGNSWENYRDFLGGLDSFDHDEIELVVYSSKDFYELHEHEGFTLTGAREGALLFDRESWLQRPFDAGPQFGLRNADRTVVDPETGDMVFLDGICDIYYPATTTPPPGENIDEAVARTKDLAQLFPNARILVRPWPVSEHVGHPLEDLHATLDDRLGREGIEVFLPPIPVYGESWVCDASFHPTAQGRDAISRLEADAIMKKLEQSG